jgi:hypothetical protein
MLNRTVVGSTVDALTAWTSTMPFSLESLEKSNSININESLT